MRTDQGSELTGEIVSAEVSLTLLKLGNPHPYFQLITDLRVEPGDYQITYVETGQFIVRTVNHRLFHFSTSSNKS